MQQTTCPDQLTSVCPPVFIMRAAAGSCTNLLFSMDGESDPACRSQRPTPIAGPTRGDVQRPAATTTTSESSQTPDKEARDILAKALRNQAEDGSSTRRAAIRAYKYLYALVQQHGPQLQRVYEASKEHATTMTNPSNTVHCLSTLPDPWPLAKITINLDTASQWVSKMGKLFFADRYVQHPEDPCENSGLQPLAACARVDLRSGSVQHRRCR